MSQEIRALIEQLTAAAERGESCGDLRCSFCNKPQAEVRQLIAGPTSFICDQCVGICVDILKEYQAIREQEDSSAPRWIDEARGSLEGARTLSGMGLFRQAAHLAHTAIVALLRARIALHGWSADVASIEDVLRTAHLLAPPDQPDFTTALRGHVVGWHYPPGVPVTENEATLTLEAADKLMRLVEARASEKDED